LIKLETFAKKLKVIRSIVLVIASGYNDWSGSCCFAEHHKEAFIVFAVVCVQIIADVTVYK